MVRTPEGSWSAPCFLTILRSKHGYVGNASRPTADVKMIIIRNTEMVVCLVSGKDVRFSVRNDNRANVLVRDAAVVGLQDGRFQLVTDYFMVVKADVEQNNGAYAPLSTDNIKVSNILTGESLHYVSKLKFLCSHIKQIHPTPSLSLVPVQERYPRLNNPSNYTDPYRVWSYPI